MLRACVLDDKRNWRETQPLIEFSYNNSYHSSIGMVPYEALYGRKCRSPLCWFEEGEKALLGLNMVRKHLKKLETYGKGFGLLNVDKRVMRTKCESH